MRIFKYIAEVERILLIYHNPVLTIFVVCESYRFRHPTFGGVGALGSSILKQILNGLSCVNALI